MAFRLNMQTINRTGVCVCMYGIRMYGWICLLPLLHFDWYDLLMSQTCFFYHFNFVILGKGTFLNYRWNCITYMLRNAQATSNFHWKYACYFVALLLSFFPFLFSAAIFFFMLLSDSVYVNVTYQYELLYIQFFSTVFFKYRCAFFKYRATANGSSCVVCRNLKWNYCLALLIS